MSAISGSIGGVGGSQYSGGIRKTEEKETEEAQGKKPGDKIAERGKDTASISQRARELLAAANEAKEAEEAQKAEDEKKAAEKAEKKGAEKEGGVTTTTIRAIPDPDDPEDISKARLIVSPPTTTSGPSGLANASVARAE